MNEEGLKIGMCGLCKNFKRPSEEVVGVCKIDKRPHHMRSWGCIFEPVKSMVLCENCKGWAYNGSGLGVCTNPDSGCYKEQTKNDMSCHTFECAVEFSAEAL